MKRALMALACAATAALVAPAVAAPAQAQTPARVQAPAADPVTALRKHYVAGHGVRFTATETMTIAGVTAIKVTSTGGYAFGKSGVAASDTKQKIRYHAALKGDEDLEGLEDPSRTIVVGKTGYFSGGVYRSLLPEGKTWLRMPNTRPDTGSGLAGFVNPVDARSLKAILATTKAKGSGGTVNGAKTTLYRGTITLGQLMKSTPALKNSFAALGTNPDKTVVSWKLWIGSDQLVRRASASANVKMKFEDSSGTFVLAETTDLAGWGRKVTVKAPPKSQVANISDIDGEVPDSPVIIDLND